MIATAIFARIKRLSLIALFDEVVVPGVFLLAVARLGNFIEGAVVGSAIVIANDDFSAILGQRCSDFAVKPSHQGT